MRALNRTKTTIGGALTAAVLFGSVLAPMTAQADSQGPVEVETGVGFFYGTFDEGPNYLLLVGGNAEEFCESAPGDPGVAPGRVFTRHDGTIVEKVNDKGQPAYLYVQSIGDAFAFLDSVCADITDDDPDTVAPDSYASGSVDLKVRNRISGSSVEVFNSVQGELVGSDSSRYRVSGSADFVVQDGVPVGDPADFVSFELRHIGH